MAEMRQEKDSLGVVEVPAGALYGAQTARAVENFPISAMRAAPALIRAVGMIKQAAAEANGELRVLSEERTDAIARAAAEVADGRWDAEFVVDVFQAGAGVSFHMNANEVIANRANQSIAISKGADPAAALGRYEWVHPNDHVNNGQSTNDVFPTAMRLGTLLALESLYPVLEALAHSFADKGREFDGVVKAGRTHMQDAVPVRLGQEFAAYGTAIRKARESIARAAESLRELGLGGSAVGTGLNTHPQYRALAVSNLSRISGQRLTRADDMRWAMQSCAPMGEVSGALRGLALEVIRISNDLRLLSSGPNTGLHEIELPALQPGSSIMPGKVNPVLAELAAMVAFQVVGNDTAVAMAVQAGQLELNVMMPAMAYAVLQSIALLTNMLRELDVRCVRGITANAARCEMYAQSTVALATALNPLIGYAKAAEVVKQSVASGRSVVELVREQGLLSAGQAGEVLDTRRMTGG
ncbi:MAG: aspartate ammonia-lyase [Acidobacteriota bacterium]|nr:aspartate ammonia-lyase [Acidobacteriota bacterium]